MKVGICKTRPAVWGPPYFSALESLPTPWRDIWYTEGISEEITRVDRSSKAWYVLQRARRSPITHLSSIVLTGLAVSRNLLGASLYYFHNDTMNCTSKGEKESYYSSCQLSFIVLSGLSHEIFLGLPYITSTMTQWIYALRKPISMLPGNLFHMSGIRPEKCK